MDLKLGQSVCNSSNQEISQFHDRLPSSSSSFSPFPPSAIVSFVAPDTVKKRGISVYKRNWLWLSRDLDRGKNWNFSTLLSVSIPLSSRSRDHKLRASYRLCGFYWLLFSSIFGILWVILLSFSKSRNFRYIR